MTDLEPDEPDADEPDAGHLRDPKKDRSDKTIRAGAVALIDLAAELFANKVGWSADPARIRNVVACLQHANFRRRRGLTARLTAQAACDRALGGDVSVWVPKDREEVAALLKRARELVAELPVARLKRKGGVVVAPPLAGVA